jgi:hypothetical protein
MKCWNSAFNTQGLGAIIIVVVQVGAVKIYVPAMQWRRSRKMKDRMKLSLRPKLEEKLDWVPVILFSKIFIPSYSFDALLCWNWLFSRLYRQVLYMSLSLSLSLSLSWVASTCIPGLRFLAHTLQFRDDSWMQISHAISEAHCQKKTNQMIKQLTCRKFWKQNWCSWLD